MGKVILIGIIAGLVGAFACVAVFRLLGFESNTAIVGGVAGAVTAAVVPTVVGRKPKE